jgi:predicted nucleic acid-binding protein
LITDHPAVIDTCVLINLLATDRVGEIVDAISPSRLICPGVSSESLYLRSAEPDGQQEAVDLAPLFGENVFTGCAMEGDLEEELYVGYSLELDDGEAMSLAIAHSRNIALATDDRKARRLAAENAPGIPLLSTPQIIRAWAEGRDHAQVASVIRAINTRARFSPSADDPLAQWWNEHL